MESITEIIEAVDKAIEEKDRETLGDAKEALLDLILRAQDTIQEIDLCIQNPEF